MLPNIPRSRRSRRSRRPLSRGGCTECTGRRERKIAAQNRPGRAESQVEVTESRYDFRDEVISFQVLLSGDRTSPERPSQSAFKSSPLSPIKIRYLFLFGQPCAIMSSPMKISPIWSKQVLSGQNWCYLVISGPRRSIRSTPRHPPAL